VFDVFYAIQIESLSISQHSFKKELCIQTLSVLPIEDMAGFLSHLRMCPACLAHSMRLRVSARALELLQDYAHHNQTFARAKLDNKQEKNDCKTLFIASTDCFDWCPMQSSLWARLVCPSE